MEAEPLLSLPMGPVRSLGDNRVGWIPNCEDAAPPRCAPVCKPTCCAFCAFYAFRYFNSARASGGVCSACYVFCACYLVCACFTRCARSTRFQNLMCNTVGHKSAPPARNVQMVDKGIYSIPHLLLHRRPERVCLGVLTRQCFPANHLFIPEDRHDQTDTQKQAQTQTHRHTEHARHTDAAVALRPAPRRPRISSSNLHSQMHPLNPVAMNCKMSCILHT